MQEDVSYVFNGAYTPLTCKLVKDALASKAMLEESLKDMKVKHKIEMPAAGEMATSSHPGKVVVVYYVGGYTFSEVAAFRHLQTILGYQFIVAGTSRLSGQDLMNCDLISKWTSYYSKSLFVQKFNFDKSPTFSRVFHPEYFDNFFREIKVVNS